MKIRTITCHHVYNYGASLQAYALIQFLREQGHDAAIIDYNPWYHRDRYNPFWINKEEKGVRAKLYKYLPFLAFIIQPIIFFKSGNFRTWGRKKRFDQFEKKYYKLTESKYKDISDLRINAPAADIYIAGSDQIWNTYTHNGTDSAYYLDFGDKSTRRIAYAASFATNDLKAECIPMVRRKLDRFNNISIREEGGVKILENVLSLKGEHVLDPVFLLEKKQWSDVCNSARKYKLQGNGYILVYDFLGNDMSMIDFIKDLSLKKGCPIVSINDFHLNKYADININDAGPLEFLSLIRNSAVVICSSFHATAFSIIFEKDFFTFSLKGFNNSSRMTDFLGIIGLEDRLNPKKVETTTINYTKVNERLFFLINKSKAYLTSKL